MASALLAHQGNAEAFLSEYFRVRLTGTLQLAPVQELDFSFSWSVLFWGHIPGSRGRLAGKYSREKGDFRTWRNFIYQELSRKP